MKETSTRRKAAVTADVVGHRPRKQRVPAKWKSHYEHLVELRRYLAANQEDLVKDAKEEQPAFSLHMADAGTDSYDRDLALSQASAEQDAVYEIDQALDRMRKGTYGICELTGKPIEPARLEAIPWTRFSLEAEADLEKRGRFAEPAWRHAQRSTAVPPVSQPEKKNPQKRNEISVQRPLCDGDSFAAPVDFEG